MPLEHHAHIMCMNQNIQVPNEMQCLLRMNQFWAGSAGSHVTPAANMATVAVNLLNRIGCARCYSMYVGFVLGVQCDPLAAQPTLFMCFMPATHLCSSDNVLYTIYIQYIMGIVCMTIA